MIIILLTIVLIVSMPMIVKSLNDDVALLDLATQREWLVAQQME